MPTSSLTETPRWTEAHSRLLERLQAEWRALSLSTDAAERARAEAGVEQIYTAAGLQSPKHIVWCNGPNELVDFWQQARESPFGASVCRMVVDQMRQRAHAELSRQVPANFWGRVVLGFSRVPSDSNPEIVWQAVGKALMLAAQAGGPGQCEIFADVPSLRTQAICLQGTAGSVSTIAFG